METQKAGEKEKIRKSLKYSILDGIFYSIMVGFGESFFTAFAIFLKATNTQMGLLGSLPQAVGSVSQLFSEKLIDLFKSRKKMVWVTALLEGLMYIPIALVFFFGTLKVFHLIFFVCLYWVLGMIIGPAWNSWMGDLVDEKERGDYFGRRARITGFASFIALLIGGYLLQQFSDGEKSQYIGFAIIFGVALVARMVSVFYLLKKYEPSYAVKPNSPLSFFKFLKHARHGNYGMFVIFLCLMKFAVFIAGPFFAAYMLYDLKLNYFHFTVLCSVSILVKYLMMPVWGKMADRFGTRKVLSLCSFLIPLVPLLWVFSKNFSYLMIIEAFSGFAWAGFEIASFNFVFDTTTHDERASYIAYYNVLSGGAIFLGAMAGSLIIKYNNLFWSKYYLVFLVSFALRCIVAFSLVPKIKEARKVENIPYHTLFVKVITTKPTSGLIHHLITFNRK